MATYIKKGTNKKAEEEIQKQLEEFIKCSQDVWYFATHYCKTAKKGKDDYGQQNIKVELYPEYPYLKKLLKSINETGNTIDEKSRQVMWSWTAMVDSLWNLIFTPNYSEKVISRKEILVDDGGANSTIDSLFGRIRFMYDHLPPFLRPPLEFSSLKITNKDNKSYIKGESSNAFAGRGGSYSKVKVDEASFIDNGESIFASIRPACPSNIKLGSTPNGRYNFFARLRFDKDSGFKVNTWHWKNNPDYTPEWFEDATRGYTEEQIAREYEIDYSGSVSGRIYFNFDAIKNVKRFSYNKNLPLYCSIDPGIADPTAIIWLQKHPISSEVYVIEEFQTNNKPMDFYADLIKSKYGGNYKEVICDPAGKQRSVTMDSVYTIFLRKQIRLSFPWVYDFQRRIMITRQLLPKLYVDKRCTQFLDALNNYRVPTNEIGEPISEKPIHDKSSHFCSALEYFAVKVCPLQGEGWKKI
jgi:hypothetical protein